MDSKHIETIRKLIDLVKEKNIERLRVSQGDLKIDIEIKTSQPRSTTIPQAVLPHQSGPSMSNVEPTSLSQSIEDSIKENQITIRSPIVGTFYRSPSPSSPSFTEVGSSVIKGQTLCIIEAMKIMNEIEASEEEEGTLAQILVENNQPVEFDQALFIINKT